MKISSIAWIAIVLALTMSLVVMAAPTWECGTKAEVGDDIVYQQLLCGPYTIPEEYECKCTSETEECPETSEIKPGYVIQLDTHCSTWLCENDEVCPESTCEVQDPVPEPVCRTSDYFDAEASREDATDEKDCTDPKPVYDCAPAFLCEVNKEDGTVDETLVICQDDDVNQFNFKSCTEDAQRITVDPKCYRYHEGLTPVEIVVEEGEASPCGADDAVPKPTLPVKDHPAALQECNAIVFYLDQRQEVIPEEEFESIVVEKLIKDKLPEDYCTLPLTFAYGPLKPVETDDDDDDSKDDDNVDPKKEQCSLSYLNIHTLCYNSVLEAIVSFDKCQTEPEPVVDPAVQDTRQCGDTSQCLIAHQCRDVTPPSDGETNDDEFKACDYEFKSLRGEYCPADSIEPRTIEIQCSYEFTIEREAEEEEPVAPDYTVSFKCPYEDKDKEDDDDKDDDDKDKEEDTDDNTPVNNDDVVIPPYSYVLDCSTYTFKCRDVNNKDSENPEAPVEFTTEACVSQEPLVCIPDSDKPAEFEVKCFKNDDETALEETDICIDLSDDQKAPERVAACPEYRCIDKATERDQEEEDTTTDGGDDKDGDNTTLSKPLTIFCNEDTPLQCDAVIDDVTGKCTALRQRSVYCYYNGQQQTDFTLCDQESIPNGEPEPCADPRCLIQEIKFSVEQVNVEEPLTITWTLDGDDQNEDDNNTTSSLNEPQKVTFQLSTDKSFKDIVLIKEEELDLASKTYETELDTTTKAADYYIRLVVNDVNYDSVGTFTLLKACLRENHTCQNDGVCEDTHICKCSPAWSGAVCDVDECAKLECKHTDICKVVDKDDIDEDTTDDDSNDTQSITSPILSQLSLFEEDNTEDDDDKEKVLVCDCQDSLWSGRVCDVCDIKCGKNGKRINTDMSPDTCGCECNHTFGGSTCECEAIYVTLHFTKAFTPTETIKTIADLNAHLLKLITTTANIHPSIISVYRNNLSEPAVKDNKYRIVLRFDACTPTPKDDDEDTDTDTDSDDDKKKMKMQQQGLFTLTRVLHPRDGLLDSTDSLTEPPTSENRKTLQAKWTEFRKSKTLENDPEVKQATGGAVNVDDAYDPYCTGPNCPSGLDPIEPEGGSGSGLSTGMKWLIALLVILGVIILLIIIFSVVKYCRNKKAEPQYSEYGDDMLLEM